MISAVAYSIIGRRSFGPMFGCPRPGDAASSSMRYLEDTSKGFGDYFGQYRYKLQGIVDALHVRTEQDVGNPLALHVSHHLKGAPTDPSY